MTKESTERSDVSPLAATGTTRKYRFIQVFNRYLNPGGEEKSVCRIAEDLEAHGHEVVRFWRSSEEWVGAQRPAKVRQPFLMWKNPDVLNALRRLHDQEKPDVWIVHNTVPVISLGL